MTDREKAIVMAYTGICMLEGEKLNKFYEYMNELYKRPVYTHEFLTLNIKERSEKDFMDLCRREEPEHRWKRLMMYLANLQLAYSPNWGANGCGDEKLYEFVTGLIDELQKWEEEQ